MSTDWTRLTRPITTTSGTSVRLVTTGGTTLAICDHPDAPDEFRNHEVGRVIAGGYQPAPFLAAALRPEVLRAIADLIEEVTP